MILKAALPLALAAACVAGLFVPGPLGAALLYPALGLFPGAALARFLPLGRGPLTQAALATALAPLVATVLGWALLTAGVPLAAAARGIALASALVWLAGYARPGRAEERDPVLAPALLAATGAGLVALVYFANPVIQIHSDGWIHAGIVAEIMTRGIPPEDPRFAGLPLNYVWFYNLFIALQSSLHGDDPFHGMALFNAWNLGSTLLVSWAAGTALWGRRAGAGTALLTGLGFNAGAWLLWPLHLTRALFGENRGWNVIADAFHRIELDSARVIFTIATPYGYMANFYDKFLVGTALNYAYLMLSVFLLAMILWFGKSARAALPLAAIAACGMLLFHGVVGISVVPVALGALVLVALLSLRVRGLPSWQALAAFGAATAAGALVAAPYTWSIARGWAADVSGLQHSYFVFDPHIVWTLIVATAAAAWLAARPFRAGLHERRADIVVLAAFVIGVALFACIVKLTLGNHVKFIYQVFLPLALVGGVGWPIAWRGARRRFGAAGALAIFLLVFAGGPLLTFRGYLLDPRGATAYAMHLDSGERALYAWMAAETPADAVFLDHEARDYIMVLGRRQLLLGTRAGPELAAFPLAEVLNRRRVEADLFGDQNEIARDVEVLMRLGRPVYVLYRIEDFGDGRRPWETLPLRSRAFVPVYETADHVVYHMQPTDASHPEPTP